MMAFLDTDFIREFFFLVVRFILALAGFMVGYFLTSPLVQSIAWLVSRKQLPDWVVGYLRLIVGIVLALIVFYYVPVGGDGFGGKGGGGGLGDGKGSGKDSPASGKTPGTAKDTGSGKETGGSAKEPPAGAKLIVEMLGPDTASGDKCYRIDRQGPPVNWETLKAYMDQRQGKIGTVEILITGDSVSRSGPLVQQVQRRAEELRIPSLITAVDGK